MGWGASLAAPSTSGSSVRTRYTGTGKNAQYFSSTRLSSKKVA